MILEKNSKNFQSTKNFQVETRVQWCTLTSTQTIDTHEKNIVDRKKSRTKP